MRIRLSLIVRLHGRRNEFVQRPAEVVELDGCGVGNESIRLIAGGRKQAGRRRAETRNVDLRVI